LVKSKGQAIETKSLDKKAILNELSSAFQHVEREAIVHVLIEAMFRNKIKIGEKIDGKKIGETITILSQENKLHFMLVSFPVDCLNEFEVMENEGMMEIEKDEEGVWKVLTVVPNTKLAQVISKFIEQEETTLSEKKI
jgi:hypothetical protein